MYFSVVAVLLPCIRPNYGRSLGDYLTAVSGGGRITDVLHSDATRVGAWEKFTVSCGH